MNKEQNTHLCPLTLNETSSSNLLVFSPTSHSDTSAQFQKLDVAKGTCLIVLLNWQKQEARWLAVFIS